MKLFDRISKHTQKFTQGESQLVSYLLSNYPHGILGSATSIAKNVGISPSSVVRFFSKLEYKSFSEVHDEVRLDVSSKLSSPSQRANLSFKKDHPVEDLLDHVFKLDIENIKSTRDGVNPQDFATVVDTLTKNSTGKVYIIGAKNSLAIAHYLHTHLNMCIPNVSLLGTNDALLADQLLWVNRQDILLAITIRRYSKMVLTAAKHFHGIGSKVFAITDSPAAPIANLSDHRFLVRTSSVSPFDSYSSAFTLCNALVAAIALRRKKETEFLLHKGEKLWDEFGVFNG